MEHNKNNPQWVYRTNEIEYAFLGENKHPIITRDTHSCFSYLKRQISNYPEIHFVRYYFKQRVSDEIASHFFRKIRHWWFLGTPKFFLESPKKMVRRGWVTLNVKQNSYFRIFATLTLIRYVEEFPFLIHEVFKTLSDESLLKEFIVAHKKTYSVFKIPQKSFRQPISVDCGHGFFSPYYLEERTKRFGKPLEEDTPEIITEPKDDYWSLNGVFMKWPNFPF